MLQRQPLEEEEELIQPKASDLQITPLLQRQIEPEEEEEEVVQPKPSGSQTSGVATDLEDQIQGQRRGGQPLSETSRTFFEPRLGVDLSDVRVHADAQADSAAGAVNARAFTVGRDVFFAAGQYAPETEAGQQLMAHELTHVIQQGQGDFGRIQRAVRFTADFTNISLTAETGATISGTEYEHDQADFSADAEVTAVGDTEAELNQWDVGVLQDMVVNWEREYWRRSNADGRGRFVEQKFRPIRTRFRDQEDGASTVWSADDEHELLSGLPKTARDGRFEVSTTIDTGDSPVGGDTINGADVTGMDASDGTRNIDIERVGTRFDTYISAHNTVTDEWRHLRRLNWNYQKSLDFTGSGGSLAAGAERGRVGHHGPYAAGRRAPLISGTTANDAVGDDANWTRRRVNGWT